MGIERIEKSPSSLIVSKEIATELQQLGYDEPTIFAYDTFGNIRCKVAHSNRGDYISWDNYDNHIPAPLYQEIIDWFREVHNHYHPIYIWKHRDKPTLYSHISGERTESFQEANNNRILHLIEKLKEDNAKKSETT